MIFSDYKQAAKRHLETSSQLWFLLDESYRKIENQGVTLSRKQLREKKQLLSNLYYLSGYIIECSYYCAIYKALGWTTDVTGLRVGSTSYSVSCYPDASASFVVRRKPSSRIKQHQLNGNMHFFQTIIPISGLSSIPLVGYTLPTTRICYDLFENWCAEIRYYVDPSIVLLYDNVFDFFYLAEEVHKGLLIHSMI